MANFSIDFTERELDMLMELQMFFSKNMEGNISKRTVVRTALVNLYNQKFNNTTIITLRGRKATDIKNIDTGLFENGMLDKDKTYDIIIEEEIKGGKE